MAHPLRDPRCPEGYVFESVLDGGPFFHVARVTRGTHVLVCKRPRARFATDAGAAALLDAEATALARLAGQACPRLEARGEDERGPYLITHWAPGELLSGLPPGDARAMETAELARALFDALASVHARGVIHGDLSPANVLVAGAALARGVTLVDFGLARLEDAPQAPRAHPGSFRGTLLYAAPEIARGEPATRASDVFALAAALLHVVIGRPPRAAGNAAALLLEAAEAPLAPELLAALDEPHRAALDPRAHARPTAVALAAAWRQRTQCPRTPAPSW